jgi:hypothetical protein
VSASDVAPRETGKRLATFPRLGRFGKPDVEVRVTADIFEGHPFVGVRIWTKGTDGNFYPSQKSVTVRKGEIADFLEAIRKAARELGVDLDGGDHA